MRVIVTRPSNDLDQWLTALGEAGHDAVALPLIDIAGPPQPEAVVAVWERLHTFDAVMFVSGNAVDHFFALKPLAAPAFGSESAGTVRAFVTGPGSRAALLRAGVDADCIDAPADDAGQFDSEALWSVVGRRVLPGYRLLIVRGTAHSGCTGASTDGLRAAGVGRDWFASQVQHAGGQVELVVAYQRLCPQWRDADRLLARRSAADGSIWLLTSTEAVANLQLLCAGQSWEQARAVVTHPRIAQAARAAGFAVVCASRPALQDLMASIESLQ